MENIYEITWLKWITCVLLSRTKKQHLWNYIYQHRPITAFWLVFSTFLYKKFCLNIGHLVTNIGKSWCADVFSQTLKKINLIIHRVIVDVLFFSPCSMWKVWINLCNRHHFDSETSHHFKSNLVQLICEESCFTLPRMLSFAYQNKFKIIMVYKDEMYSITLHQKKNGMIYRITCNVFFCSLSSVWKVQINIGILHHVTVSQALFRAYVSSRYCSWWPGMSIPPRHFASHVTPISTLIGPLAQLQRSELHQKQGEGTNRSEFCRLWGIDKLIFWSHYVLKQLRGRLLLCSIRHIVVNCLRNADCWKVSPLSGTWCELLFCKHRPVPTTWGLRKPIDSSVKCMGSLYS